MNEDRAEDSDIEEPLETVDSRSVIPEPGDTPLGLAEEEAQRDEKKGVEPHGEAGNSSDVTTFAEGAGYESHCIDDNKTSDGNLFRHNGECLPGWSIGLDDRAFGCRPGQRQPATADGQSIIRVALIRRLFFRRDICMLERRIHGDGAYRERRILTSFYLDSAKDVLANKQNERGAYYY
jgi:hypothetical protein